MDNYQTLADELTERIQSINSPTQFWLAITGAPGSGKSTLSEFLASCIGESSIVIPMDGYHFYRAELDAMPNPSEAHLRRGAPFTFNAKRFVDELSAARETASGRFPAFEHGVGDPVEKAIELDADKHRLVIVEGNYLLLPEDPWTRLAKLFDETWFIAANLETIRPRLVERKIAGGYDAATAEERVEANDIPNAQLINKTCQERADRVISG